MSRKLKRHNTSPELAFDACDYFTDDLSNFNVELDAREKARLDIHAALRDACCQGDVTTVSSLLASLSKDAELIVNMAPSGASTLLFTACQTGCKDIVKVLLDHGADGRYHPVTKYSPLYIACHYGHRDIVEMLLLRFPELIQQHTVERWLPIHASAINGHVDVLELLFHFPYPSHVLRKFRDGSEQWEYFMPFDINERDATGQNILYMACLVGNKKLLDVILKFKVKATRIQADDEVTPVSESSVVLSPTKRRISDGIQSILSKLNLSRDNSSESDVDPNSSMICPLRIDMYCNNNTETALHAAIKGKHYDIALALLNAGANSNAVIKAYHDLENLSCCSVEEDSNYGQSTGLVEACRNRDVPIVDLLLKYGARDDECKALSVAVQNKDETLTAKLLSTKAHPDPEFKINKKAMTENVNSSQFTIFSNVTNLTYSALFPNTPTMINWHNQRCNLTQIRTQWLTDAALHLNQKLKQNPRSYDIALYAITRLDVSNNNLTSIPLAVFQLYSLRYLNIGQNKIEKLPTPVASPTKKGVRKKNANEELNYSCPVLEELYLQDNRLDHIPDAIFRLPSLVTLVVSNNKLQQLSYNMWLAPKLKELNASFNLLKELPTNMSETQEECDKMSVSSSDSQLSSHCDHDSESEVRCDFDLDSKYLSSDENSQCVKYRKKERSFIQFDLAKHHIWSKNVEVTEQILHTDETVTEQSSKLSALNLAHNLFTSIPVVLPCLAVNLTRLNMAFNSLRSMSHITSYPSSLKQLDLSHNQITCWPSLPQVEAQDVMELANIACYASSVGSREKVSGIAARRQPGRSVRNTVLHSVCSHRRHLKLDSLRTLILADNQLSRIQLSTDDDGDVSAVEEDDLERRKEINTHFEDDFICVSFSKVVGNPAAGKARLMFPNLSMLDVSNNNLKEIPININELSNLSVLNISGNLDVNELPPQMGLLSRLWNLNTRGCSLQDPLKSMIDSKKYKTMDIVGYLKSVLEDARPYARMKLMIVGVQGIGKTSLLEQLRQEGITRKRPEHWAKRMGNKNINVKTSRGTNMSTVGVDIGDWVYEKKVRNQSSHGPVIFRTWDFGGQKEYYATHQYFLSKRSLYLVVWRITDGHRGINEILQWLVNIQARAPNSPVIIVGTHYDVVQECNPNISEEYQQLIRDKFINIVDAEKCGLPRVLDTIEISCRTRHNVKLLCNLIYDTVFSLRPPGSKELLLEQKVPATYLALEDVVNHIAAERRVNGLDPVLNAEQYRTIVTTEMQQRFNRVFRDWAELHQATLFLHDNGVLLHYDDATLKDLYFLDPQWLCDMLAHVVTIREINPFARSGVMKLDDLKHIFKASSIGPMDARGYIVNLLNKFEVALTWDSRTLLIPSLLPSEEDILLAQLYPGQFHPLVKVKVPLRSRGWAIRNKKITVSPKSVLYRDTGAQGKFQMSLPSTSSSKSEEIEEEAKYQVTSSSTDQSITRLLLMSYFPSGFWSRLISRILADDTIIDIIRSFFILPKEVAQDLDLVKLLDLKAEWVLWQTGLQLKYGDITLFRMREILHNSSSYYRQLKFRLKQDGVWCDVDLQNSSILEIHFPVDSLVIKPVTSATTDLSKYTLKTDLVINCTPESTAQLLALAVDHVDILLEDWYPTLGTRFVHTSEGKFLVTRLVPCPRCLQQSSDIDPNFPNTPDVAPNKNFLEAVNQMDAEGDRYRIRKSQESYTSECDSGVGPDSTGSSRMPSMEGHPGVQTEDVNANNQLYYSWMVEECILASYGTKCVVCPAHGDVSLARIAPDTIFLDLGERYIIRSENVKRGRLLGRGAFGFVFKGTCKVRGSNTMIDVAMKMLQPVPPGPNARQSAIVAYKAAQGKWDRDPLQYACKAYCTARQELNILLSLRHPNIVPFVGVCTSPLAIVLDLAPQGALDLVLRHYRRSGAKVGPYTLQAIILQVAKAIEYLHRQHIIYRDLKSENVLVWEMPPPFVDHPDHPVHIKVADYGISRLTLPSGAKGFGGTEGFMAPEIMRYNGEEEYTEKVDCFSFGMFIYELLTLHQPFEGHESVKECILEGGRPPLTYRETLYPSYFLDLMVLCWSQQPKDRPSASQIVSIASAPEFTHLSDVTSLKHEASVVATASAAVTHITDDGLSGSEMWLMCSNSRIDLLLAADRGWLQYHTMALPIRATAACTVANAVWIGDYSGNLHAYSASDGYRLFSYALETEPNTQVEALLYLPPLKRVACALSNGRLFLVNSEAVPTTPTAAEGTFVMTELGSNSVINCLCAIFKDGGAVCELWCGESNGQISIFIIKDHVVAGRETMNHYQPIIEQVNVMNLIAADNHVWSYVRPGCIIYQWDQKNRTIINKLDCSKLVPCSESLKSIAIEEHLSPTNCQVTSLAVLNEELYIGTTWGCVIIAERATLRPITIFRPYEEEVKAIVPLAMCKSINESHDNTPLIATIGRGYRNLLSRYTDVPVSTGHSLQSPMSNAPVVANKQNMFVLLWRAEHWNAV
ncbi:leucine-rich repeat serine/threonine-protein kinase 1 isoform X3 [Tribolium castaneum]|uniref:leucine-rich repeat serine/threonine-protein kinase 1 isoform X3 n=1 Tax=Tribolium castaneum TaxID=7070 RepID=UPI00077DA545|nr:PREDICTED: leucine-rich repeat serine/threonine-protein kinase 1 isoform X4 [Tribolium castaneum]|eukprot:XP_015840648.1 PREDICTED: leucine-rich repeat serine/threonine-protein kinase 1 isoform X4 [Tribolium castaneum]